MTSITLYEQFGGEEAVDAIVDHFYEKVLQDDRINTFFRNADMAHQRKMMKSFLTHAFGGPDEYTGKDLRSAHAHLVEGGLRDSHFDAMKDNINHTLKEYGISDNLITRIDNVIEQHRNDVLNKVGGR